MRHADIHGTAQHGRDGNSGYWATSQDSKGKTFDAMPYMHSSPPIHLDTYLRFQLLQSAQANHKTHHQDQSMVAC